MKNMHIHYDQKGDFLEIRMGQPTKGHFNDIGDDLFERIDEKTGKVTGLAVFNFKKRTKNLKDIDLTLPFRFEM
jgi:uncharacterized protein YuzE